MKKYKLLVLIFNLVLITCSAIAQKVSHVKGTIGKEKGDNMIVVCVFGTKACMPLSIDESMKTDLNGKMVSLKDLSTGTYIEADLEEPTSGRSKIKNIKTDINKTVICFIVMSKEDEKKLNTLLKNTNGVKKYKFYDSSKQVYIEYNHELINYMNLEKTIIAAGFKVE